MVPERHRASPGASSDVTARHRACARASKGATPSSRFELGATCTCTCTRHGVQRREVRISPNPTRARGRTRHGVRASGTPTNASTLARAATRAPRGPVSGDGVRSDRGPVRERREGLRRDTHRARGASRSLLPRPSSGLRREGEASSGGPRRAATEARAVRREVSRRTRLQRASERPRRTVQAPRWTFDRAAHARGEGSRPGGAATGSRVSRPCTGTGSAGRTVASCTLSCTPRGPVRCWR